MVLRVLSSIGKMANQSFSKSGRNDGSCNSAVSRFVENQFLFQDGIASSDAIRKLKKG
jgi:hypothetical protein